MVTVTPKELPEFRRNPGKGWMLMSPGPDQAKFRDWPWVSLIYHRVDWARLEPEESKFVWEGDDWEDGFRPWIEDGYPVGLDVMCCNPHGDVYSTPKWVHDAGAKGRFYLRDTGDPMAHGKVLERWEPDYNDPLFHEKLANFLAAFADRYDDDPAVEYVTMRSYGTWGEWTSTEATEETLHWMVETHLQCFKKTQLLIPVGAAENWETVTKPTIDRGVGVRKDGTGGPVRPGETELMERAYHHSPNMLEFWGPRSYLKGRGWDVLYDKEECIYGWHASRVNMGFVGQATQWVENEPDFLDRAAARMGYRFRIREATYTERVAKDGKLEFSARLRNDGIATYTRPGAFILTLRDGAGHETLIHKDQSFPNRIAPIGHHECRYELDIPDTIAPGEYSLLAAMEDYYKGRISPIRLAHEDGNNGRVDLGTVEIV